MATIPKTEVKLANGFTYLDAPQGSPEWLDVRVGRMKASRMADWLAVSKTNGKPLKARTDLEAEIAYEKEFGVSYDSFVTDAMQDGIAYEDFVAKQYEFISNNLTKTCGAFYNDVLVASPDRLIDTDGVLEIKVLRHASFMDVLQNGVPHKYFLQIQSQLLASGRKWGDFVAANLSTKRIVILRVERDEEVIKTISDSLKAVKDITPNFDQTNLYAFTEDVPQLTAESDDWLNEE